MATGHKGDFAYANTGNALVEFFSKAGSLRGAKKAYHGQEVKVLDIFRPAWKEDNYKAMQLSMYLRDCRGGSGARQPFREITKWLGENNPEWISANIHLIPLVGRWDDLSSLFGTKSEDVAVKFWAKAIEDKNGLACKWAPREKNDKVIYHKLRKALKLSPKEFRKFLSENTKVVETQMCSNNWYDINYNHVPSVAMARSANAFTRHDGIRFQNWKESLVKPDSGNKVNASVLFPHDCMRTMRAELGNAIHNGFYNWSTRRKVGAEIYENSELANAQFDALPNYMEGTNLRIMPICDFSGSMEDKVSGSISRLDVSMSLGLYCSDRVGKNNPFYRKFIPFSNDSRLVDWRGETFSVAAQKHNDGWCGSTNIASALRQILESAKMFNATNDQIPNCLLIISDMQWDPVGTTESETAVEYCMKEWNAAGYTTPKIVYWNLAGYETSPSRSKNNNVAMVSGFSPSVMTAILGGEDFTPMAVMERAIEKYKVVRP